ncbi:MAG: bifunctional 4-hydroxy-2-oxoglutarate aldolase/2-dehydro-3-deoxy-phosphogluconate aldolase [Planctomycetota bacterium]
MTPAESTTQRLCHQGAVAVIRTKDPEAVDWIADTLVNAGITALEVTLTVPDAVKHIGTLAKRYGKDHLVGVGSVLTPQDAHAAIDAGAAYVVSPLFNEAVVRKSVDLGIPAMPGCFTPTEIARAMDAGASIAKVFPADVLGMPFFKAVLAPMPNARLMPTGGVTTDNAGDWLRAGAVAVGVGSALVANDLVEDRNAQALTKRAERLIASIAAARNEK